MHCLANSTQAEVMPCPAVAGLVWCFLAARKLEQALPHECSCLWLPVSFGWLRDTNPSKVTPQH